MGCGSSSGTGVVADTKSKGKDNLVEPQTDPDDFPTIPDGYPPPNPSRTKKAKLFDKSKYSAIEDRAMNSPDAVGDSFTELNAYLFNGLQTDLEKVRAIFCWIGHKNQTKIRSGSMDSPNSILLQVQENNMSFAYLFARLCREANIPCVIIRGLAKSVGYEVGDEEGEVKQLTNRWNGVFVGGEWRIVFPLWAFAAVSGHSTGKFTLVETKGAAARDKEKKSSGVDIVQFNEYYFLPDPEDFVNVAMASDPKWQFIEKPFTLDKFCSVPLLRQTYFSSRDVEITFGYNSRLHSENGQVAIGFKALDDKWDGFLTYELFFNDEESKSVLPSEMQLDRYVVNERNFEQWKFMVRCPVIGVYKLKIYSQWHSGYSVWLCSFKLFCNELTDGGTRALPLNVGPIGWGPSNEMVKAGLTSPSQRKGFVVATAKKEVNFSFSYTRKVSIRTVLVHSETSSEKLESYISQRYDKKKNKVNIAVCVPDEGEYALQIHAKDKQTNTERNACNYIISTDPTPEQKKKRNRRENVTERKVRDDLKTTSTGKDLEKLEMTIAKFEKMNLDDKGDLNVALKRQNFLKLKKDLDDAVKRRHLEVLDTAIEKAENSEFKTKLEPSIKEADEVRQELIKLNRFAHDILAMKQPTVSELHSYKIPQPPIMDVMVATFTLLGERKDNLQEWEDIQSLLRTTGRKSVIRRVREFPEKQAQHVNTKIATKVQALIRKHDEESVRLCSPAAGTFYVWVNNVVTDILDTGNRQTVDPET
ncbi:lim and transglutaminase domain protein ltd-1-like isoform X2 [Argopecten irradians]|uniref:lim and transglutaminase domain protein ltd-1-like isoform X2 n=1 Tax=Argopecten irradians TaxID=31199 RepID=UPI00371457A3